MVSEVARATSIGSDIASASAKSLLSSSIPPGPREMKRLPPEAIAAAPFLTPKKAKEPPTTHMMARRCSRRRMTIVENSAMAMIFAYSTRLLDVSA